MTSPGVRAKQHTYTKDGTFTISVFDANNPQRVAFQTVEVPFTGSIRPAITLAEDPADAQDRRGVLATVDNHGNGAVRVTWGEAGAPSADNPGDGATVSGYKYTEPGVYTIRVDDINDIAATTTATVRIPLGQAKPVVTATPLPGKVVEITVDNKGNGPVRVKWGDTPSAADSTNAGDGKEISSHGYTTSAAQVTIEVTDPDDPSGTLVSQQVTLDTTAPPSTQKPTVTATPKPGKVVDVVADNKGNGPVTVEWGDNPAVANATNAGDGAAVSSHTYTTAGPNVTITVWDPDNAVGTRVTQQVVLQAGQQQPPVQPTVTATPRAGKIVDVVVDNHNQGPVQIKWGDTPVVADVANAGNNAAVSSHTYTTTGQVTITVTDADDPAITATRQVMLQARRR